MINKLLYFIYAARFKTLVASLSPILITSAFCYKSYSLNLNICFLTLIAAILIQIMTNFINDLYDYKKGADNNRVGPDRMIQKGYLSENEITKAIYLLLFIALLIGTYLALIGGVIIVAIGLSAFLFAYLYTATRFSIAYNGLGELFVFIYFGLIASLGTCYLQILEYNKGALLIGIMCGSLNVCLLIINNLRDIWSDKSSNKNTLVAKYGKFFGYMEFIFFIILSYISLYYFTIYINNTLVFMYALSLIICPILILFLSIKNTKFLNQKALPIMSFYITLFTLLLTFNIIK